MYNETQKIYLSIDEINQILTALGKIPAEYSINLILFIKEKADEQLSAAEFEQESASEETQEV